MTISDKPLSRSSTSRLAPLASSSTEDVSLVDALGGPRGLLDAGLPGALFVALFIGTNQLSVAAWGAVGLAAVLTAIRLICRETLQHALSGFFGIALCAFIAQRSGRAENFYLPGLLLNAGCAAIFGFSVLVRWPLLGLLLGPLTEEGTAWRQDPPRLAAYSRATWIWMAMFGVRVLVQAPLYLTGAVVALGVTRIMLGVPLYAVVLYLSWLVLKQVPVTKPLTE